MKVLFAVTSESISDAIVKRYQKEYKEILSYKNVYYFNAILKEIQKDKTYDRIVISEDLESFSKNNYDAIDKFLFEKLDNISDEAQDIDGNETSIIFICSDRRTKGSSFLVKLFSIGVYNALLGNERSMEQVCKLINKPRVKKEAKSYYKIDANGADYSNNSSEEVSELEIQNILSHFRKLGKNTDKYSDSFNNIAAQYTDEQLKIVINCLPTNVKIILEDECDKYREIMSINGFVSRTSSKEVENEEATKQTGIKIDLLENRSTQTKMSGPIVIPSSVRTSKTKGPEAVRPRGMDLEIKTSVPAPKKEEKEEKEETDSPVTPDMFDNIVPSLDDMAQPKKEEVKEELVMENKKIEEPEYVIKKVRTKDGQIKTVKVPVKKDAAVEVKKEEPEYVIKKVRTKDGQIKTVKVPVKKENPDTKEDLALTQPKKPLDVDDEEIDMAGLTDFEDDELVLPKVNENDPADEFLPGMDDAFGDDELVLPEINEEVTEEVEEELPGFDDEELPGFEEIEETTTEEVEEELPGFDDVDELDDLLPGMDDEFDPDALPGFDANEEFDVDELPGFDDVEEVEEIPSVDEEELPGFDEEVVEEVVEEVEEEIPMVDETDEVSLVDETEEFTEEVEIPGLDSIDDLDDVVETDSIDEALPEMDDSVELISDFDDTMDPIEEETSTQSTEIESIKPKVDYSMSSLNSLMTKDKKIVTFIGTSKNGTSFLVNNLAALFSSLGISTAILDMTKNKNSYYIYTNNDESLRNVAYNSISKLQKGFAEGIKVDKNLSVYTALPNDGKDYSDAEPILSTLVQNHSLVLIDCDYDTDPSYFASCQEIYLVQSMDILTIQPLTAFLRDLKAQGVMEAEKVRVVINKELKSKTLTVKAIIGGMSFYNDPSMSFMTELFNKDMVKACSIPFDESAYIKYIDSMVNCNVSLNGYSKQFISRLRNLGDMVYPLVSKSSSFSSKPANDPKAKGFSSNMNSTLNQMKKKI